MVGIVVSFWGPAYFQELLLLVSGRVLGTSKIGLVPISSLELIVGFEHVTHWDSPNVQRSTTPRRVCWHSAVQQRGYWHYT